MDCREPKAQPLDEAGFSRKTGNHAVHQEVGASLLYEYGTDTGSGTQDTILQHRESGAVQGYCKYNKYVPHCMGPTAKPCKTRRVYGKYTLWEAGGIKEKSCEIRRDGWKYRSFICRKSMV
jgi:hypothetical protein